MTETARPVVLLVDDEAHVLSALRRGLRRESITIETARSARAALMRLEESPAYKQSIFQFAPKSTGAAEYFRLSEEVLSRV